MAGESLNQNADLFTTDLTKPSSPLSNVNSADCECKMHVSIIIKQKYFMNEI
jgi:hypothetical protein|tara:strand:- start:8937 stop:9092 length:156 start_codon:yes stop_codon:yes gene_type:complete